MNKTISSNPEMTFSLAAILDLRHLQFCIEQFYYYEAALLDDRRFSDWLNLFSDDTHYWMPIRRTVMGWDQEREFTEPGDIGYFDDDKEMLNTRIKKLASPSSWSETPPSRTRHNISNIRITDRQNDEIKVESNFQLYRSRFESEENIWLGRREDVLIQTEDTFQIKRRKIYLDQTIILATNMSCFF